MSLEKYLCYRWLVTYERHLANGFENGAAICLRLFWESYAGLEEKT